MGKVVSLLAGRRRLGRQLPKPRDCEECGDRIETARLQVQPKARRCISCEQAREFRHRRAFSAACDDDVIIVRR